MLKCKKLWIVISLAVGIPILLAASPFVALFLWGRGHANEVRRLTAEIEQRGEPLTIEQLTNDFPIESGREDVTAIWIEALEEFATKEFKEASKTIPYVGTTPAESKPWENLGECEAFLVKYQHGMDLIHDAARRGGDAKFPVDYSMGIQALLPHVQESRNFTRLLQLEFAVKAQRGDVEGASRSLSAMFTVQNCCAHEPLIVVQLVRMAMNGCAKTALAEQLCRLRFDSALLREYQTHLRAMSPAANLRFALLGERAMINGGMQDMSLIDAKFPAKPAMASDAHAHLKYMTQFIAAFDLDFPKALHEAQRIEGELKKEIEQPLKALTMTMTALLVPANGALFDAVAKDLSTNRAADAGIAVELYRREHGKLPDSLDSLVPKYLPNAPIDPFNGKPLIYKVTNQGFWIYSVGKNKVDDGGRIDNKPGEDNRIRDEGLYFPLK